MKKPLTVWRWLGIDRLYDSLFALADGLAAAARRALAAWLRAGHRRRKALASNLSSVQLDVEGLEKRWLMTTVQFSSASYSAAESAGLATISVTLDTAPASTVTVNYATADGSATAADYTSASGTLTFLTTDPLTKNFTVYLADDDASESNETVSLTLSGVTGPASLGSPSAATLTITNSTPAAAWSAAGSHPASDPLQGTRIPVGMAVVDPHTGSLSVAHALDLDRSPADPTLGGQPALVYHSETAVALPILQAVFQSDGGGAVPTQIKAQLTWNGGAPQSQVTFATSGHSAGDAYLLANQVASAISATGRYPWSMTVVANFSARGDVVRTVSGNAIVVVNGSSSPFGHGWSLAGLDSLVSVSGGVLYVYGTGGARFFAGSTGTFTSPANDFGTLVESGGSYTYTDKFQTAWHFDSGGKLTTISDPHGLLRTFTYGSGRVSTIADPDGSLASFSYDGAGKLNKVEAPGPRTTTVTVDGSGDLTLVQNPDAGLHSFSYSSHRLTGDHIDPVRGTFAYSAANGTATTVTLASGSDFKLAAAAAQGLATNPALNSSAAVGVLTDARGNAATYTLDTLGRTTKLVTADTAVWEWQRDAAGLVTVAIDPLGKRTTSTYDGSGDLTRVDLPDGTNNQFTYHATFHKVTRFTDGRGYHTTNTYDGANGDLLSVEDPYNYRTTFTYSNGLVQTETDPLTNVTTFNHDAARRLEERIDPLTYRTTYQYDAASNATVSIDENGNRTTTAFDGLRRVTRVDYPGGQVGTFLYSAAGLVTDQTGTNGVRTTSAYDSRGLPTSQTEGAGTALARTSDFYYDANGNLTGTRDPGTNLTAYLYDKLNRQTVTVDPVGNRSTTLLDLAGRATGTQDANANLTQYLLDSMGRATVTIDPDSKRTTQILDGNGNATSVTDPLGKIWSYLFDKLDRATVTTDPVGEVVSVTFDGDGNQISWDEDDDGGETSETNVYDGAGQQIAEVDAAGARTTSLYDKAGNLTVSIDAGLRRTSYLYDFLNRATVTIDPDGNRVTTLYDSHGFVTGTLDARSKLTQYLVDGLGRSTVTVDAEGGRTTSVYDAAGRATQVYDPRNNLTQYVYDAAGKVTVVIDADSKRTTSLYDTAGNLTVVIDALNRRTTTVFDSNNRRTEVIDPTGARTTTYYDAAGHVTGVKDARAKLTQYLYDDAGRLTVTVDAGDGRTTQIYDDDGRVSAVRNANNYLTTYLYDSLSRATVTIDAENNRVTALYDVAGRQTGLIDGRGNLTQYQLDAVGRTTVVINADSKRTTTLYDANGNVTSVKDANNNVTEFLYDALNRKTVTLDPRGTYRTSMLYDAASNLTSMRDAQNNVTTFAYDSVNRKIRETDPLGEAATFTYNAVGLLTSTTDRLARRRDFQYDAANRLTTETWFTSGTAVETILYSYDAVGNRLTAQNGVGTYTMTYDALNRATVVNGLWGVTLTMLYDAVGNRTEVRDSFGGVATSTYDKANRLTQRKLDAGTPEIRADQTYNGAHQVETQTRWSDLTGSTKVGSTTYTYDAVNRVTAIDHRNGSGTLLATYLYSYKDNSELLTQKINGGATTTYGYDAASQLTADGATNYTYDGTGNRTNGSYSTGTGNRLTTDGTWDYSYDEEGNETQKSLGQNAETWEYGYDHRNQMTSAKQYSAAAGSPRELWSWTTYRYDANGNRVEKVIESVEVDEGFSSFVPLPGIERYALDGWKTGPQGSFVGLENWDVWADLDAENALQVRYLRGDVIDQLFARIASGSAKWELVDRLGSVLAETDSAGAVASSISYDGFGNAVSGSLPGRYQFTGREKDIETGLQYNRGRYLDTLVARWTSTDPIGFNAGDSNLYRYVKNNSTQERDPSGLQDEATPQLRIREPLIRPARGLRGGFLWPVDWVLDKKTVTGGWVVQEIKISMKLRDAAGKDITNKYVSADLAKRLEYWEAWKIEKGNTRTNYRLTEGLSFTQALFQMVNSFSKDIRLAKLHEKEPGKTVWEVDNKAAQADIRSGAWENTADYYSLPTYPIEVASGEVIYQAKAYFINHPELFEGMKKFDVKKPNTENLTGAGILHTLRMDSPRAPEMRTWLKTMAKYTSNTIEHNALITWNPNDPISRVSTYPEQSPRK